MGRGVRRGLVACDSRRRYRTESGGVDRRGYCGRLVEDHGVSAPSCYGGGRSPSRQQGGAHRSGHCGRLLKSERSVHPYLCWGWPLTFRRTSTRSTSSVASPSEDGSGPSGWACGGDPWAPPSTRPPISPVGGSSGIRAGPREPGSGTISVEGSTPHNWGADHGRYRPDTPHQRTFAPNATVRPPTSTRAPRPPTWARERARTTQARAPQSVVRLPRRRTAYRLPLVL